jgi:hypothetical protein
MRTKERVRPPRFVSPPLLDWPGVQPFIAPWLGTVLAPRILHFTVEELIWECITQSRCERQVQSHHFSSELPIRANIHQLPFRKKWSLLVEEFSERDLSFQADRLPAISGLAMWMQKSTDTSYWAGLWSDDLPGALLWWVLDRKKDVKASRCISKSILPYQAPTWSWARDSGVWPPSSLDFPSAPFSSKSFATASCPYPPLATRDGGVWLTSG